MTNTEHNTEATTMDAMTRLENALESAEALTSKPLTLTITLTEVYRISRKGFSDAEATYWAERIENLLLTF